MIPAINAAGDVEPVLYVFHGVQIPYRSVVDNRQVSVEALASHLPRKSLVTMRKKGGGVDGTNVFEWSKAFVEHARLLTAGGRELLLT